MDCHIQTCRTRLATAFCVTGYTDRNANLLSTEMERQKKINSQMSSNIDNLLRTLQPTQHDGHGSTEFDQVIQPLRDCYHEGKKFRSKGGEFILRDNGTLAQVEALRHRRFLAQARQTDI